MLSTQTKVWFVTGSSTGLGRAVVTQSLEKGDKVVATLRNPQAISDLVLKYPKNQLLVIKLDVVSATEINAAFAQAISTFGRIDVVYNNAGAFVLGEVESVPEDAARSMLDVNFWGATNVAREAVRIFRDVNKPQGGRLLQASSIVGIQPFTVGGFYSVSKHALEAISQALSNELHPSWNIKITLLELGNFDTPMGTAQKIFTAPPHPAYTTTDSAVKGVRDYISGGHSKPIGDPKKAAREILKIALDENVGLRVPLGHDSLAGIKAQLALIQKDLGDAEKWSADLKLDV